MIGDSQTLSRGAKRWVKFKHYKQEISNKGLDRLNDMAMTNQEWTITRAKISINLAVGKAPMAPSHSARPKESPIVPGGCPIVTNRIIPIDYYVAEWIQITRWSHFSCQNTGRTKINLLRTIIHVQVGSQSPVTLLLAIIMYALEVQLDAVLSLWVNNSSIAVFMVGKNVYFPESKSEFPSSFNDQISL